MPDDTPVGNQDLQFDRVISETGSRSSFDAPVVECANCHEPIHTTYYDIDGKPCCERCRLAIESFAETPTGVGRFMAAGAFGIGAGIVGAAIYYAVIAIAHVEIGIVAILIGYMVGYAVRKGAAGRGGLRFQILAVVLTYGSVALAYTPVAIQGMRTSRNAAKSATGEASTASADRDRHAAVQPPSAGGFVLALAIVAGFIAVLPVLVVFGSLPSGLISGFIIFIGMKQAWKMTGALHLEVMGPYRVGAPSTVTSV
jgi:hypothetical protein